ncbi:MAG: hypothetical protein DRP71_04365 [Verrucomicrobia bacterium]|nr:MAG: hypothetical protein DRP71_04365 [Verrucomicrobiota bacterium]
MSQFLVFTRNRRIPLNIRRLVGGWFIGKSDRTYELDVGSVYRGALDNYIEWMVYITGQYFEFPYINLIRRLHNGGIALDIGANVGNHALAFSEIFDQVYAVEPYSPVYRRLAARREISDRIHPFQIALSDRSGSVSFHVPETDHRVTSGWISEDGEERVESARGDEFVAGAIEGRVSFVKIDVEGHESRVLEGLADTIRSARPTMMVEASKEVLKTPDTMRAFFALFPDDYVFHTLSGQSSWPVQRDVARTTPIDSKHPRRRRHSCDMICFGREKNFRLQQSR